MHKLVLLRHGLSEWNLQNRFTGWYDVDLADEETLKNAMNKVANQGKAK